MPTPRRIVIVGATSSIAEHCARLWAAEAPSSFVLVARDAGRAGRIAADLRVRGATRVDVLVAGFVGAEAVADAVRRASEPGPPDLVLVAHGSLPEQARCQDVPAACEAALVVDGVSPAMFAEAFAAGMFARGAGTLVVLGSARSRATAAAAPTRPTARPRAWCPATSRVCSTARRARPYGSCWSSRARPTHR
jgi:short-subunit dehydrogenase